MLSEGSGWLAARRADATPRKSQPYPAPSGANLASGCRRVCGSVKQKTAPAQVRAPREAAGKHTRDESNSEGDAYSNWRGHYRRFGPRTIPFARVRVRL
jgi:hypothetical protein